MTNDTRDTGAESFDLEAFLPYALNQAAETLSRAFQPAYRDGYGLSRTQWRVLAIAGRHERTTSRDICAIAQEEKSKVSRAVAALERDGLIEKTLGDTDKRTEVLTLTARGDEVRRAIGQAALGFDAALGNALGKEKVRQLRALLDEVQNHIASRTP